MSKIDLKNITLVSITSIRIEDTLKAMKRSMRGINFASAKLLTDVEVVDNDVEIVKIHKLDKNEYSRFVVYDLHKHIDTEFAIQIQSDGYIVHPESWTDEFLQYDYIGAPWGWKDEHGPNFKDRDGNVIKVGNGISLRSKKVMEIPSKFNMPWISHDGNYNEDTQICIWNRNLFLDNGVKFAPFNVATKFSHEEILVESFENGKRTLRNLDGDDYGDTKPFCFHNFAGGENNERYRDYNYE